MISGAFIKKCWVKKCDPTYKALVMGLDKKIEIQIREEGILFPKCQLANLLGISLKTLNEWISQKRIKAPSGKNNKYTNEDILIIAPEFNLMKRSENQIVKGNKWILEPHNKVQLKVIKNGLFIVGIKKHDYFMKTYQNLIDERGLWAAQGLINHQHMVHFVENLIAQYLLAKRIIEKWFEMVIDVAPEKSIMYLNGKKEFVICIYSGDQIYETFLRKVDKYLRIKDNSISNYFIDKNKKIYCVRKKVFKTKQST